MVGSIGESISLTAFDSKNSTSNTFDVDVSSESTANYRMIFRTENLKMVAGDYDVEIIFPPCNGTMAVGNRSKGCSGRAALGSHQA